MPKGDFSVARVENEQEKALESLKGTSREKMKAMKI